MADPSGCVKGVVKLNPDNFQSPYSDDISFVLFRQLKAADLGVDEDRGRRQIEMHQFSLLVQEAQPLCDLQRALLYFHLVQVDASGTFHFWWSVTLTSEWSGSD